MKFYNLLLLISLMIVTIGCEQRDPNEPHSVHFDRDMCERCKMVISDRNYVAQIVDVEKRDAYNFDDIGCAVLWLDKNGKKLHENHKFYIADKSTGEFIDINSAYFSKGGTTPMDFGISASKEKSSANNISYDEAKKIIYEVKKIRSNKKMMKRVAHE